MLNKAMIEVFVRTLYVLLGMIGSMVSVWLYKVEYLYLVTWSVMDVCGGRMCIRITELWESYVLCTIVCGIWYTIPLLLMQVVCYMLAGMHKPEQLMLLKGVCTVVLLNSLAVMYSISIGAKGMIESLVSLEVDDGALSVILVPSVLSSVVLVMRLTLIYSVCSQVPIVLWCLDVHWETLSMIRPVWLVCSLIASGWLSPPDCFCFSKIALPMLLMWELLIAASLLGRWGSVSLLHRK